MNVVTIGGVLVGLSLVGRQAVRWWPGSRALRKDLAGCVTQLVPFVYAFSFGVLVIMTVGGFVGMVGDAVLWASNWVGDAAFVWGVGGQAQMSTTGAIATPLTAGGMVIVLIMCAIFPVLLKKKESLRQDLVAGAWAGVSLGLTKAVAMSAAPVIASAANLAGAWISTQVIT